MTRIGNVGRGFGVFVDSGSEGANRDGINHLSQEGMFDVLRYDDWRKLGCSLGVSTVMGVMSKVFLGPGFAIWFIKARRC